MKNILTLARVFVASGLHDALLRASVTTDTRIEATFSHVIPLHPCKGFTRVIPSTQAHFPPYQFFFFPVLFFTASCARSGIISLVFRVEYLRVASREKETQVLTIHVQERTGDSRRDVQPRLNTTK